jgi:hypothetical protein
LPGWQWPLTSQHPVGQVLALQPWAWQLWLALHVSLALQPTQFNPLAPQAVFELPVWHWPWASQHPAQFEEEQRLFTQVLALPVLHV